MLSLARAARAFLAFLALDRAFLGEVRRPRATAAGFFAIAVEGNINRACILPLERIESVSEVDVAYEIPPCFSLHA